VLLTIFFFLVERKFFILSVSSPRNRASKMRERHQLFFGLQLLVSKEFHHLANKNRAALWRTLKFWNPSHATVPFSKSSPFYDRWKICFSSNIQRIRLVCMFFKIYLTLHINVQSSQIWSAWEWCHWIGKSTRAIGFYFFTSHSWIYLVYKVLSSFIKSNLLQVRFACAQTYHDWCTLVKRFCQSTALFTVCKMMEFFTHKEL
jgi:hypothetical protein